MIFALKKYIILLIWLLLVPSSSSLTMEKVVLVTGANKGIGKEISRMLGSVAGVKVVMGARDSKLGIAAAAELKAKNCDVVFHQLDLTDHSSIERTYEFLDKEFGRVDIIINNAALCYNDPTLYGKCAFTSFQQQAAPTISTNFFGTLDVTQTMLPLLRKSSSPRIINIASSAGRLSILRSKEKLEAFTSPTLQVIIENFRL
jgi:carbonyl reductase 1